MNAHIKKVEELINDLNPILIETCERYLKSGFIDIEDFNDNEYALSKILLSAALEEHKKYFYPLLHEYRYLVKDLSDNA